ncbi:hypothetical protein [Microvirga mediterraneensis]|uniref:Sigma-70 family RNA polymerase sigma factor n=1 Tax=Microvirga mediterraneensis TaxID=2754695 RepID=A0A838BPB6_9HYPH|nr:hypothetical protein [Microvirga mediterraneensis]MBA1156899.1 hypothetical protein [Microvirga mediterraneensis]MBA1157798.1 hypothetical protein [Microvirga mediterraneensis]
MSKRRPWSEADDRFLTTYYGECGVSAEMLAEDLQRTVGSVRQRLLVLGVKAPEWKRKSKQGAQS